MLLNSPPFKFSIRSSDLQNRELIGRKLTKSSSDITRTVTDEYIISTDGKVKLKKNILLSSSRISLHLLVPDK